MADEDPEGRPDRTHDETAEQAAGGFADPLEAHCGGLVLEGVERREGRYSTKCMPTPTVFRTQLSGLERIHEGKVRDIYAIDAATMLIVTSDRLSAFDVVLPDPIPDKGFVLNSISNFWFERTRALVPNHLTGRDPLGAGARRGRAGAARRARGRGAAPEGAAGRGGGARLPDRLGLEGLPDAAAACAASRCRRGSGRPSSCRSRCSRRPTRPRPGAHDENIDFAAVVKLVGADLAAQVRATALALYGFAAEHARQRGIIVADTKFEFGVDEAGTLTLMDEVVTPDSSRFWPADTYQVGTSPPSFDKQYVRDYLETLDWNKKAPGTAAAAGGDRAHQREVPRGPGAPHGRGALMR